MSRRLRRLVDRLLDGANPAFALTVRMKNCRRIFLSTALFYSLAVLTLFFVSASTFPATWGLDGTELFEIGFLVATCCSVVFLGSDFGSVFIESTFHDELLRLTPLTPTGIVHGGIASSLFFSAGLTGLAFAFLGVAAALHYPVGRAALGTVVLFAAGQALNAVLLSCYLYARCWREIGLGAVVAFLLIALFAAFCFTALGRRLFDPVAWPYPMTFLLACAVSIDAVAYALARCHAAAPRRTFRRTVLINVFVYVPLLLLVSAAAIFWPVG